MSQRNASIDLFRFLGAFSVILIHSIYANKLPLLPLLGRWAVPFFFMVSGYFFQKSYRNQSVYAFAKTGRALLSVFLCANLFYMLFLILTVGSLKEIVTHFTLLVGTHFHLWFLTSLLLGYLVLWFFLSRKLDGLLPYLAAIVLIVILGLNPYSHLLGIEAHPIYARSLLSIPFLCIGFLTAKYAVDVHVSKLVSWLLIGAGIGLQVVEAWLLSSNWQDSLTFDFMAGTLLFSVGMFLLSLQLPMPKNSHLSYYGRRYSLQLYLYHPVVNYFLYKALVTTKASELIYWMSPLLTVTITLSLLVLLDRFVPVLFGILSGDFSRYNSEKSKLKPLQ
ncbi:acyltransferase [Spirosoma flavum]|uniref:Acyltransferase n=1 Tax=Spirosoma flavum TaxID=2048557 RepID=A0ABW6ATD6_9BACT